MLHVILTIYVRSFSKMFNNAVADIIISKHKPFSSTVGIINRNAKG